MTLPILPVAFHICDCDRTYSSENYALIPLGCLADCTLDLHVLSNQ